MESVEVKSIDNHSVRKGQIARLEAIKASRDNATVQAVLAKLTDAATTQEKDGGGNLLEIAVEAARARATLGEISSALETVYSRHKASTQVVQGAYSASYNTTSEQDDIKVAYLNPSRKL